MPFNARLVYTQRVQRRFLSKPLSTRVKFLVKLFSAWCMDIFNGYSERSNVVTIRVNAGGTSHVDLALKWSTMNESVILSVRTSVRMRRFDAKRANRSPIRWFLARNFEWRNLAWRFSRNKYIHTRAPVCARACTNTLLSRDHHHPAISCVLARTPSRTTSNRDIRISILIHSPRWPFARFDASYIWNSSSLSLYSSVYILPSLSRCVFSTLITNFDNIRSRSVNICMQNAGWGLYIFCIKRVCMKISVEPVNGAVYV